jgi:hypothetical protein
MSRWIQFELLFFREDQISILFEIILSFYSNKIKFNLSIMNSSLHNYTNKTQFRKMIFFTIIIVFFAHNSNPKISSLFSIYKLFFLYIKNKICLKNKKIFSHCYKNSTFFHPKGWLLLFIFSELFLRSLSPNEFYAMKRFLWHLLFYEMTKTIVVTLLLVIHLMIK